MDSYQLMILVIFLLMVILFVYQIYRWYQVYLRSQEYTAPSGQAKVLKKPIPRYQLSYGSSYLLLESNAVESFKLFSSYISRGSKGLLITRVFPKKARKQYNLGNTPVLWLSRTLSGKSAINPTNLGVLLEEVSEFIKKNRNTLVLLDGLEYLIIENDFERVLKFINSLEDEIAVNNSRLLVSVNPDVLDPEKKALLEKTSKVLVG